MAHPDVINYVLKNGLKIDNAREIEGYSKPLRNFKKKLFAYCYNAFKENYRSMGEAQLSFLSQISKLADEINTHLSFNYTAEIEDQALIDCYGCEGAIDFVNNENDLANFLFLDKSCIESYDRDWLYENGYDEIGNVPEDTPKGFEMKFMDGSY